MLEIGCKSTFWIEKFEPHGAYLINEELDRVLLPQSYVAEGLKEGDSIEVFVYNDSEDRPVAVTTEPYIQLNDFAYLNIKSVTQVGAFADWGLPKDLLIPFREQNQKLVEGHSYLVFMFLDEDTNRLVGSTKLTKYLDNNDLTVEENEEVDLIVWTSSELGVKVIVNNIHLGLVYQNEIFQELSTGDTLKGYVKHIRLDNKLDISLQKQGIESLEINARTILEFLKQNNGTLALHDKSAPEDIKKVLSMSKKAFKSAIGTLYKKRLISMDQNGIQLFK